MCAEYTYCIRSVSDRSLLDLAAVIKLDKLGPRQDEVKSLCATGTGSAKGSWFLPKVTMAGVAEVKAVVVATRRVEMDSRESTSDTANDIALDVTLEEFVWLSQSSSHRLSRVIGPAGSAKGFSDGSKIVECLRGPGTEDDR